MKERIAARVLTPTTAALLGALSAAIIAGTVATQAALGHFDSSASTLAQGVVGLTFAVSFTAVGVIVARRMPRNPLGWLLLALVLAVSAADTGAAYARLDYTRHHGRLPLGPIAVLLSPTWEYAFLLMPLIILLFPDGRLGSRWRWPLRAYGALMAAALVGTTSVAVSALRLRIPVDGTGTTVGLNHPSGANAWFAPVQGLGYVACFVLALSGIVYQVIGYRRSAGERRQQIKCLAVGGGVLAVCLVVNSLTPAQSGLVADGTFSVGFAALPIAMGIGILRFRLYDIDRLISRTVGYALLTALLVGTFIGLVALTTDTLALSGRVGVAASTLAAAALFNPLRVRVQRLVDRRFNRAHYDAEETVAAFSARLRDAVELDAIRHDLLEAVNRAVQPAHASVWIRR